MAQKYSPYAHPPSDLADYFTSQSPFPPLYPLLLALFGGGHNLLVAHVVTTSCLLLALPLLLLWTRKLGLPHPAGLLIVIAYALLPGTYNQTLFLHSENLYLLLTLLFFTLSSLENPEIRYRRGASLAVAAATLTRSAGLALAVAYVCYLSRNRGKGCVWHAGLAVIPIIAWNLYAYTLGSHYVNAVIPTDNNDLSGQLFIRASTQWSALKNGWLGNLSRSGFLSSYSMALGGICLTGSVIRLLLWRVDGLYVGAYLALLLLWPYPAEAARFMVVLMPILLVHGAWLAYTLIFFRSGRLGYSLLGALTVPLIALMVALPDLALSWQRFRMDLPPGLEEYRRDPSFFVGTNEDALIRALQAKAIITAATSLEPEVPEGECIFAVKPSIATFFSNRISKSPPLPALADRDFLTALEDAACRHFLLINLSFPTFQTPLYPLDRLGTKIRIVRSYDLTTDSASAVVAQIGELVENRTVFQR